MPFSLMRDVSGHEADLDKQKLLFALKLKQLQEGNMSPQTFNIGQDGKYQVPTENVSPNEWMPSIGPAPETGRGPMSPKTTPMDYAGLPRKDKKAYYTRNEDGKLVQVDVPAGYGGAEALNPSFKPQQTYVQADGTISTSKPFQPKAAAEKQSPEEKAKYQWALDFLKNEDLHQNEPELIAEARRTIGMVENKVPGKKAAHWWQSGTPDETTWGFPESSDGQPKTGAVARVPTPTGTGGLVSFTDSQGVRHRIPAKNLPAAKKRDPGLKLD